MPPVGRTRFVRACREADPETVAGFVAALYEARGWTVERTADRELTATRGFHSQRVVVRPTGGDGHDDGGGDAETADVAVVPKAGPVGDARALDYGDLHRQVSYAVDRGTAADLLELLGLEPDSASDPTSGTGADADADGTGTDSGGDTEPDTDVGTGTPDADPERNGPGRPTPLGVAGRQTRGRALLFIAVGLAALVAAAVVTGGPLVGGATPEATPAGNTTTPASTPAPETATATGTPAVSDEPWATPVEGPAVSEESLVESPPGVGRNGSVDPDRLVRAHRAVVANTSFTMTLTVQEFVDGRAASTYAETVRVADGAYSATVLRAGDQRYARPRVVGVDAYDDGTVRFSMVDGTVRRDASTGVAPVLNDSARLLRRHLSTEGTMLEDVDLVGGTRLYRLSTTADRLPGVANATGTVYVTREGVVRFARWSYVPRLGGGRVVVTWQVTDVGETTVTRPAWLPGERDA